MGLIFNESRHPLFPVIRRSAYKIAGKSGTVLLGQRAERDPLEFTGTLVMASEPETRGDAQAKLRAIAAWLLCGRQKLIFDYEPDVYYLAEVAKSAAWTDENWFGGEISVTFTAQPYARSVTPATAAKTSAAGSSATVSIQLTVQTGDAAPLEVTVENTGSAALTAISLMNGKVRLEGMSIPRGSAAVISAEEPIGAHIVGGESLLPYAAAFDLIEVENGVHTISAALTFAGSGTAKVTASARGRW